MRPADDRDNLHTIWTTARELLPVECRACRRRALIGAPQIRVHRANMDGVNALRLTCSRCGGSDVARFIPGPADDLDAWLKGAA